VFRAHDIGYFFYNGGNDSMDTALKCRRSARRSLSHHLCGHTKPWTMISRHRLLSGFGSVAKYVAVSTREAALDVASMARTSTGCSCSR